MLSRRLQRFIHNIDDRLHLDPLGLAGVEVLNAIQAPTKKRHFIFGNIDAQGIRRALAVHHTFLQRDLPVAREQPVDKYFCGIGMRRTFAGIAKNSGRESVGRSSGDVGGADAARSKRTPGKIGADGHLIVIVATDKAAGESGAAFSEWPAFGISERRLAVSARRRFGAGVS